MNIVLVHPRIPQNAGAVARLAAATHSRLILVRPLGFRLDTASVRRAGVDYWDQAKVEVALNLEEALDKAEGDVYYFSRFAERPYWQAKYESMSTLVFGSEAEGLPPEVRQGVEQTHLLRIPIPNPQVRSLNLATSVAIALYEAMRQVSGE